MEFVKPVPQTTSLATDIVSPAQLTLNSMLTQEIVIVLVDSIPMNSESALRNAEPTNNTILILINVNVSRDLEEFKEDAQSVHQEQKLPLTDPAALTVKPTKFFSVENVYVNKDMPTTQLEFVQDVKIFPTDSSSMDSAQSALKA